MSEETKTKITVEEDLINKWLFAMIRGDHTFLLPPDEDGKRFVAIKIQDVMGEYKKFKAAWEKKDA